MLRVRFFARVREALGCEGLTLPVEEAGMTLAALEAALEDRLPGARAVLQDPHIRLALNQAFVEREALYLKAGDELAFLPPVTGG
jgi:molybdopterin converting factor subunit 1